MKESAIERRLIRQVRIAGGLAIKIAPLVKGVPDRLVLWPDGRSELVELKTDTGVLSPAQREWHLKAAAIHHPVTVLSGVDEVNAWLNLRRDEMELL